MKQGGVEGTSPHSVTITISQLISETVERRFLRSSICSMVTVAWLLRPEVSLKESPVSRL